MAELLTVFILQLLFGTCRAGLLQKTSAGLRSVHPGDNITLHCDITVDYEISWGSVDLVIVGVGETDLGLYYCGGRNDTQHIQFGKAIRLIFTGGDFQSNSSSAHTDSECLSPDPAPYQITTVVLGSVCLISVLTNLILTWVFCYRVQGENFLIDLIQNQ
ncbi:hypothetical protein NFI96_013849 [Prochilodus magdalenae]|nr:hypothetical protein NFI96_013849 [Prochilodus magdalenae]